jgi:hypothetical protein
MDNGNTAKKDAAVAGKDAAAQSRARVITYLTYALDDVGALSPMAVHLLEMAIAILNEEPSGGEPATRTHPRPS